MYALFLYPRADCGPIESVAAVEPLDRAADLLRCRGRIDLVGLLVQIAPQCRLAADELDVEIGVQLAEAGGYEIHHVQVGGFDAGGMVVGERADRFGRPGMAGAGADAQEEDLLVLL